MAAGKYTMTFELATNTSGGSVGHRVGGWSESWYMSGSIDAAKIAKFKSLCQYRAVMLPASAAVSGQRYQTVDPVGPSSTGRQRFPGQSQLGTDVPQLSLLCRVGSIAGANFRQVELRGLPDSMVEEGEYKPNYQFTQALTGFFRVLQEDGWQFRGRDLEAPTVPIVTLDLNGAFVLADALTFGKGDRLQVIRTVDEDGIQSGGFFRVATAVSNTEGTLSKWIGGDNKDGKMRIANIIYPSVNAATMGITGVAVRKVGRPSNSYRGRRSRRRKRPIVPPVA